MRSKKAINQPMADWLSQWAEIFFIEVIPKLKVRTVFVPLYLCGLTFVALLFTTKPENRFQKTALYAQ